MAKDTNNLYSSIHVRYLDSRGYPQSESFDEEELNNLEIDMNTIFEEYRKAGVQKLVMEVSFTNSDDWIDETIANSFPE